MLFWRLGHALILGLGADHLRGYPTGISEVTTARVGEAARLGMPHPPAIVVVGRAARLRERLEAIGPIRSVDGPETRRP